MRDHDVAQNYAALLEAIEDNPPASIQDLGCGPARDLRHFRPLGHEPTELEGSVEFVAMARASSGCEVLQQNFLETDLRPARFHGAFANASLFPVPGEHLPRDQQPWLASVWHREPRAALLLLVCVACQGQHLVDIVVVVVKMRGET